MSPAGDYRRVNIYPSVREILSDSAPLRKNIVRGKYGSVHDYLDIHFNLLREDFVACLREGVQSYRSNKPTKNIDVYSNIRIFKDKDRRNVDCLKIKIPQQEEDSKKFMTGSLLLFTRDNFNSMFMAKVVRTDTVKNEATIELVDTNNNFCFSEYTMAESGTYFDPYFQVLSILQNMSSNEFPMEKYLIQVDTSYYIPRYLLKSSQNYVIGNYKFPPQMLPKFRENCLKMNEAQFKAFRAALSREFVVIQGPPGTGKTFLGLKIVETLIKNSHFWYKNSPILVVSYKNFALDQFLEGLIPITNRLIRVGGQSKSEKLRQFNLTGEKNSVEHISKAYSQMGVGTTKTNMRSPKDYLTAMKNALVVGMTTSIAARWKSHLEELQCPIVIVEEAAEVLESHVLASLTPHCQHLILLGDHQQLQPLTADHSIGKKYDLGVSLFERMINNGIQCYTLDVQHRMRPEISNLLKVRIYPFLRDHESVQGRPPIAGVDKDVFFVDHRLPEETVNVTSKMNSHEVDFIIAFAKHLILNGYKASEIVILASYAGQVQELQKYANSLKGNDVKGVRIMTLDAFQGREADIVLLSLVRSESVGFLSTQNRVCVALSRAKNGFYIIGNMELLSKKSRLWYEIKQCLKNQNSIGEKLPLKCQIHSTVTKVGSAEDFLAVRDGGCDRKCQKLLHCGHQCQLLCHTKYKNHQCKQRCKKSVGIRGSITSIQDYRNNLDPTWNYEMRMNQWKDRNEENLLVVVLKGIGNVIINGVRNLFNMFF